MTESELIAAMLEDLNQRLEYLECENDPENGGLNSTVFRGLKERLDEMNKAAEKKNRKPLPR